MTRVHRQNFCWIAALFLIGSAHLGVRPGLAETGETGPAIFTASDFPALAKGIETGISGEVSVRIWTDGGQDWRLSQDGDTLKLSATPRGSDPLPRWQNLGKVTLRSGHSLKVHIEGEKKPQAEPAKDKTDSKSAPSD